MCSGVVGEMSKNRLNIQKRDPRDELIARQKKEIDRLTAQLATMTAFTAGGLEGVTRLVERLQGERDYWLERTDKYQRWLPMKVINGEIDPLDLPPNYRLNTTGKLAVGASVFWRNDAGLVQYFQGYGVYPGSPDEFIQTAIPQIALAIMHTITPEDLGKQTVPGVRTDQLLDIISELWVLWPGDGPRETYNTRRAEIFNALWPTIEQEIERLDTYETRESARNKFNKTCDNTISYAKRRHDQFFVEVEDKTINLRKNFSQTSGAD